MAAEAAAAARGGITDGPVECKWSKDGKGRDGAADPHPHFTYAGRSPKLEIQETVLGHIGQTPLVRLNKIPQSEGIKCEVLVKCEFFNSGGSVKDRIALRMVEDAERAGRIKPGDTLIEPTSGNTGIGLALAAAVKGYKMVICLPEKMSKEKVDVLRALGAEIIRTPTEAAWDAPESHISVAQRLEKSLPNAHILDQYANPSNPLAHYDTTAEEILEATGGKLDMFCAGAGTGGTLTGTARKLREKVPGLKIVGLDPLGSILAQPESLNANAPPVYHIEGIGYDFIPKVCDRDPNLVDKWVKTSDQPSFLMCRRLIREEGLLAGGSSGTAVHFALQAIKEDPEINQEGKRVVVILPDGLRNYMTKFLADEWMVENGFLDKPTSQAMSPEAVAAVEAGRAEAAAKGVAIHGAGAASARKAEWGSGTVADLKPVPVVSVASSTTCADAVSKMEGGGFDNVPVLNDKGQMIGLLTIGQLLAKMSRDVAPTDTVEKAMFTINRKRAFVPVTMATPLAELQEFFEENHVAFVSDAEDPLKVVAVISKIDILRFLVASKK